MILHRMAFHLFGKEVASHLENITAKAYLCNGGGIVGLFPSRLACFILNPLDKHGINFIPAHIYTHLNVEADYLLQGSLVLEWLLLLCISQVLFQLWAQLEVGMLTSSHTNHCQHFYPLGNPLPLAASRFNTFNYPWTCQVSYASFPSTLVPLVQSKFLVEHVTGQSTHLILVVPFWLEASWHAQFSTCWKPCLIGGQS